MLPLFGAGPAEPVAPGQVGLICPDNEGVDDALRFFGMEGYGLPPHGLCLRARWGFRMSLQLPGQQNICISGSSTMMGHSNMTGKS